MSGTDKVLAALVDTVVAPEPVLPPVEDTDAVSFFAEWLDRAPRLNAVALRAALRVLDAAPLALGYKRRFRALPKQDRIAVTQRVEKSNLPQLRQVAKALRGIAFLCYYGDDGLMRRLGYDAGANVARARRLRAAEGRP